MVLSKIRVSQNFCELISWVSQSRFLCGCQRLGVSTFCKVVSDYRSRSRILKGKKVSGSSKKNASLVVSLSLALTIRHPYFLVSGLEKLAIYPLKNIDTLMHFHSYLSLPGVCLIPFTVTTSYFP